MKRMEYLDIEKFDKEVCEEIKYKKTILGCMDAEHETMDRIQKYRTMKHKAEEELRVLESRRAKCYMERYHHHKFEREFTLTTEETKRYVEGDDIYRTRNKAYQKKKLEIEALEDAIAGYKDRGWRIKNLIELFKMDGTYC